MAGLVLAAVPGLHVDPRAALVGMAAMFAGASRAVLTSVAFAFEITGQPHGLLPLLAGCMSVPGVRPAHGHRHQTGKIARRLREARDARRTLGAARA